jgi:two-component system chemotaxis response regulator CheB
MKPIKVLVVDDSAVMRSIMSRVINSQPDMTVVGLANDPIVAMERMRISRPDVMTLDVEMPRMDGLEFLKRLMQTRPMPVVMVSSLTARGADVTLRALELGAVDFIAKPQFAGDSDLASYAEEVAEKLRAAAGASVERPHDKPVAPPRLTSASMNGEKLIVVGASTGGVEALREVLARLPENMPPLLIAQHMPGGFTRSFAQRLDGMCEIGVGEGQDGETLRPGRAYIAPGGRHMLLAAKAGRPVIRLSDAPPVNRHRPSVDTLFRSAAEVAGARCIGVMLSGMGSDGADAMRQLRDLGAYNIAQDEASCVVFGMPKQAITARAVHEVLPLREIPQRLVELCVAV